MGVRRVLAGIVALAPVSGGGAAAESRPTACTFSVEFTLVPGLSLTPSSGEFTSGQTGEIACGGTEEGNLPAGKFTAFPQVFLLPPHRAITREFLG
jgi:hypothetical protein